MITQALAVNGAKVYIAGRTEEKLERVVELYGQNIAGEIIPLVADVSTKEGVAGLVKEIESREKCLCILVNNAGIATNKQAPEGNTGKELRESLFSPENATYENWAEEYKTNVVQLYMMTTAFLPLLEKATEMHKNYSGTVINTTSISGSVKKSQGHFAYNSSKGAADHLTKLLASEVANHGVKVRINAIAPGIFPSEMTTGTSGADQKSELEKDKYAELPAQRPGKDEDMASAVLFLATNQYLNGQIVTVDGGYLLKHGQ